MSEDLHPPGPAPQGALSFGMVAGEASGDLLASLLLKGMRMRWQHLDGWGIGGPRMVAEGFNARWASDRLAVRGYFEVLRHYRGIVALRDQLREELLAHPPQVFIGVDAPDFNLDLEARLKAHGIPTVHMVCPSIWAWRAERIHKIRRSVDHMLCIFPFEVELLERQGVPASYIGHPLAPIIPMEPDRAAARQRLQLQHDAPVVALLPGSRVSEIEHMTPRLLAAAQLMQQQRPDLQWILPAVPTLISRVKALCARTPLPQLKVLEGQSHEALAACDLTLIASGTATLEAALFKRPMVIAYHMNTLSWQIMRRQRLQPWVGLPNILCGEFVVPELLQSECSPQRLAREGLAWLEDEARVQSMTARFTALHRQLTRDTALEAVHAIEKTLQGA